MFDRSVQFPNRYRLVPVVGTADVVDIIPAPGEIGNEGTPINKGTMLNDETAAIFGFGPDATVDDMFRSLAPQFDRQRHTTYELIRTGRFLE